MHSAASGALGIGRGSDDLNIVICDDTERDAISLRLLVERYFSEIDCYVEIMGYENGDRLLEDLTANVISDVKIAFLDIYMPGTNGIDTAKKIRETDKDMTIIFTTTSKAHGLDGFSVYALQYLVKPVKYPEIKDTLDKCTQKYADSLKYIEVLSDRLTVRSYFKDIMYIECFDTALFIHTPTGVIKTFLPLSELEKQLKGSGFLRTQRSYIVNLRYVDDMVANEFILENGKAIPIRRSDRQALKQAYWDYLSALTWKGI